MPQEQQEREGVKIALFNANKTRCRSVLADVTAVLPVISMLQRRHLQWVNFNQSWQWRQHSQEVHSRA